MEQDCVFCKIINKTIDAKIIFEDEKSISFLDTMPTSNGHIIVVPKIHTANLMTCDDDYLNSVMLNAKKVAQRLSNIKKLDPWGFNYLSNQGSVAGQEIFHFHLHVIPKYARGQGFGFAVNKVDLLPLDEVWSMIKND